MKEITKPTDEDVKAKHEIMNRILSWGTLVFLLIVGYALNYHEKFELRPTEEQRALVKAKKEKADALTAGSRGQGNPVLAAECMEKAAQANLEARVLEDDMRDAFWRAVGLILAAFSFFIFYFLLIRAFYRKYESEMASYILSKKHALIYAGVIGLITLYNAVMTGYQ